MGYLCFLGGNGTMGPIQRLSSWWPRWLDIICPAWRMWYFTVLSKSHESCISSYLQYRYLLYIRISYFDDRYTYIYIYVYVYIYWIFCILTLVNVSRTIQQWIVRSSWSQMKRPKWSLITGAAWFIGTEPNPCTTRMWYVKSKGGVTSFFDSRSLRAELTSSWEDETTSPVISLLHREGKELWYPCCHLWSLPYLANG